MPRKETQKAEEKTYRIDFKDFKPCIHDLKREGIWLRCTKCHLMFRDPEQKFPIQKFIAKLKQLI